MSCVKGLIYIYMCVCVCVQTEPRYMIVTPTAYPTGSNSLLLFRAALKVTTRLGVYYVRGVLC